VLYSIWKGARRLLWALPFLFALAPGPSLAQPSEYVGALLARAKTENLHDDRYWHTLLHNQPAGAGWKSLVDDARFFLSPSGKRDPAAEIQATLRSFFESDKTGDDHPRCRFPARYAWLKARLNLDDAWLPEVHCAEWEKVISAVRPQSAALIFPSSFMNTPASMFGHTLIRIDGPYESKLLSYAANYAAYPDRIGLAYPFKGIFGFYKGYFSLFPYYDFVKKYSDTEQRDMWEYTLDFSSDEVTRMTMHLWELKEIYSDYYFFDENCSFNLLFLLEAARPSLHLTDLGWRWTIPVDTIRVVRESGIVKAMDYRPARATRMKHLASLLSEEAQKIAREGVDRGPDADAMAALAPAERMRVLDLSVEALQYVYAKEKITKEAYLTRFLATLNERSKLGLPETPDEVTPPTPPHAGHRSSRWALSAGVETGHSFYEVSVRPAYHHLNDPDAGYLAGSQIVFANTTLRWDARAGLRLEAFDLIDIVSLSPRDLFFTPLSFKIKTGLTRWQGFAERSPLVYQINPGVGLAFQGPWLGLYYGLAEADLNFGGAFQRDHIGGIGVQVGTIKQVTNFWKVNLSAETLRYDLGELARTHSFSAVQTFRFSQDQNGSLSISWGGRPHQEQARIKMTWNAHF